MECVIWFRQVLPWVLGISVVACGGGGGSSLPLPQPTRPVVEQRTPLPFSDTALVSSVVSVRFSEPMRASTINTDSFTLVDSARDPVAAIVSYDDATNTALLAPDRELAPGRSFLATLVDTITSQQGVPLAEDVVWSFATGETTVMVSVDAGGRQSVVSGSRFADTDGSARLVVFESDASDLVADDSNGLRDIFVKDTVTGAIRRANLAQGGFQALTGASFASVISADGRYVAFESLATDLVLVGTNGLRQVFVKDLQTGAVTVVSSSRSGEDGNGVSSAPAISGDGRFVAFASLATNLGPRGFNGQRQVYVRDLHTGVLVLVSRNVAGEPAGVPSDARPAISGNGELVAFESLATDLLPGGGNGLRQVYVRDLVLDTLRRVSSDSLGQEAAGGASSAPALSADGSAVAFESLALNLAPGGGNGFRQIYLKELDSNLTRVVSASVAGGLGDDLSQSPRLSADGRFVTYATLATNIDPAAGNGNRQILIRDMDSPVSLLASSAQAGVAGNDLSEFPVLSEDGNYVVYQSLASNLVDTDTNLFTEVFRSFNRLTLP